MGMGKLLSILGGYLAPQVSGTVMTVIITL
jgi:hypothetical protein